MVFLLATTVFVGIAGDRGIGQKAFAQTAKQKTHNFNIPAKPVRQAMNDIVRISGIDVVFPETSAASSTGKPVRGSMTTGQAIATLLAGTNLSYSFVNDNTVTITSRAQESGAGISQDGSILLDAVTISGQGSGTNGYVAGSSSTGSKTDTPLVEVPQAISIVTKDQIRDQGAQTVSEALRYTAGVTTGLFGTDPRFDQMMLRGFNSHPSGDFKNGLRQPTYSFSYFKTEAYGLERIDVLKGPSSVLYGQGAPGGVVDRVTKKPTEEVIREVQGQIGSNDRYQGAFDFSGPVDANKEFLYRLTGVLRDADSFQHGDMPDDRRYIAPSLSWQPSSDTKLTILGDYMKDNVGWNFYHTRPDGTPTHIFVGEPSFDRYAQEQYSGGYEFEHRFSEVWQVKQNLRWGRIDFDGRYVVPGPLASDGHTLNRFWEHREENLTSFTVDNQAIATFDTASLSHKVLLGLDYQRMDGKSNVHNGYGPSLDLDNPVYGQPVSTDFSIEMANTRQKLSQVGIYLQDQIKYQDRWVLTLGGRHDWADLDTSNFLTSETLKTTDSAFTGRVGLTYLSDIGLAPYVSYSTSFLPQVGTTSAARGSKPFEPTTGEQYEAGIKYEPTADSLVTLSVFSLTQGNMLSSDPDDANQKIQTGKVRSRGVELEGAANLTENLRLKASYTYQDMKVVESTDGDVGKWPVSVPANQASLWADYTVNEGMFDGLGFGAGVRFTGKTYADAQNTQKNDSSAFVDASIHYERDGLRLAVNATNLFDKQVATCSFGYCYWQEGRTILGTLTRRW
ncbi:TonB-dependent siderophore receptor [Mesorhizobium sp. CGMCC 1.15528]|uniref:TonB-dependent siderophore receptor n=2 Tax=Mesorhizobium TaxID=68287 RepID=A0A7C9V9C2_9HYPH|nr:TonB-dependent siderophore receptor [Mesorhizobium zhangyense]NGN43063.1 TonB-dependent siderophore receptor [Mesorhizobium zhangyense]